MLVKHKPYLFQLSAQTLQWFTMIYNRDWQFFFFFPEKAQEKVNNLVFVDHMIVDATTQIWLYCMKTAINNA